MHLGQPANKKIKGWIGGIAAALGLFFLIFFYREVWDVLRLTFGIFLILLLRLPLPEGEQVEKSFEVMTFNCLGGFGLVFLFWLFLISSQALLPVRGIRDIYRTAFHLLLYILRRHGPAFHIKDGEAIAQKEELDRRGPGVIVVDFNSAVVLEERKAPPGLTLLVKNSVWNLLNIFGLTDPLQPTRVCGPGIIFTHPDERLRGAVDLRRQFRMQPKVQSYTRDGIELRANTPTIFTIGQDPEPDALHVTYIGEHRLENLRVVSFSQAAGGGGNYLRVSGLSEELDVEDAREIHHYARVVEHNKSALRPYEDLGQHPSVPIFNPDRVLAAVFAQARTDGEESLSWSDLPARVGAGLYREIMQTINYDDLYDIKGNGTLPLPGYKRKVMLAMRNNGLLAFRMVYHSSGQSLAQGSVYAKTDLLISPVRQLTTSKMLRDRGIKVSFAGFGDPMPTSPLIYQQRLDTWRARWEKELDISMASRELQAMRIHSRAMAEAQQDLWYSLSQVFSINEHNDEALAVYVMQALEAAAADPKTRELLPGNTLDFMKHIQTLLAPPVSPFMQLPGADSGGSYNPMSPGLMPPEGPSDPYMNPGSQQPNTVYDPTTPERSTSQGGIDAHA